MSARCAAGHELAQTGRPCTPCRRDLVAARVAEADATLGRADIDAAIGAVVTSGAVLRDLAAALADGPAALAAGAPPTVGRLVTALRARGSVLEEPACVRCRRTGRALTASDEGGVCGRCRRRQLACACTRCQVVKPVASRDEQGRPLCAACAPRRQRPCSRCGRVRTIARRARDGEGDVCDRCYKGPLATCGVCAKLKQCNFVAEGRPVCMSCSPRRASCCAHCGQLAPASVRWPEGPVCEPCYRRALSRRGVCAACGDQRRLVDPPGPGATRCADCAGTDGLARCASCWAEERPYRHGLCVRCALAERAREVCGDGDGPLAAVRDAIVAAPQPYSAHNWLRSGVSAAILSEVASGALAITHEALDAHPHTRASNYLRHILVAYGALAPRDDAIARLEAWATKQIAAAPPEQRRALRSYATWRVLRRARQRSEATTRPPTRTAHAKICLNAAVAFLAFLASRGTELGACTQEDVDAWSTEGPPSPSDVSDFLEWAATRKLVAHFTVPARHRHDGPALDDDMRWDLVRRLLHDATIDIADRVAGCLVLLYGQQLSRIVTITRSQLTRGADDDSTRLHLGTTYIDVPEPLSSLVTQLAGTRRPNNGVLTTRTPWLFPGLDPGQPLNASHLGLRLRKIGVPTMRGRRSALVHLACRLPAAVLSDLLGIHPTTAVHWVRSAGGDWNTYAAAVLRDRDRGG